MNVYDIYLRKGASVQVSAIGFIEDKRAKRFYFYTSEGKKDRETFFRIEDVAGIHLRTGITREQHEQSIKEFNEMFQAARKKLAEKGRELTENDFLEHAEGV
jgi:Asp-tRNA(Asn)/Glu-tRNA(Gln) amidotransferase A subunit family amidase